MVQKILGKTTSPNKQQDKRKKKVYYNHSVLCGVKINGSSEAVVKLVFEREKSPRKRSERPGEARAEKYCAMLVLLYNHAQGYAVLHDTAFCPLPARMLAHTYEDYGVKAA